MGKLKSSVRVGPAIHKKNGWHWEVRVMAVADGYVMVRRKGAMPYVACLEEIDQNETRVTVKCGKCGSVQRNMPIDRLDRFACGKPSDVLGEPCSGKFVVVTVQHKQKRKAQ